MSLVKEALKEEIRELMHKSVTLAHKRDNSKSDHGKQLFTKKLIKNNRLLAQTLEALERLPSEEPNKEVEHGSPVSNPNE